MVRGPPRSFCFTATCSANLAQNLCGLRNESRVDRSSRDLHVNQLKCIFVYKELSCLGCRAAVLKTSAGECT